MEYIGKRCEGKPSLDFVEEVQWAKGRYESLEIFHLFDTSKKFCFILMLCFCTLDLTAIPSACLVMVQQLDMT